jgi:hypothetical protein
MEWDLDEPNSPLRGILGGGGFSMARDAEGKLKKGGCKIPMDAPHVVAQWTRKVAVLTLVRITATKDVADSASPIFIRCNTCRQIVKKTGFP